MSSGEADRLFGAAEAEIAAGAPLDAIDRLAAARTALAADPRLYRKGFEALSAAAAVKSGRGAGELTPGRAALYRQLMLQEGCGERPLIFHHGIASLLTSSNVATAKAVTLAVTPLLREMIGDGPPPRALLIFLLVARSCLGDRPSQAEITRWHLDAFPTFSRPDLMLPYSVMFNAVRFAQNRADLLERYRSPSEILGGHPGLGLQHILLLEWLGAPAPFTDGYNRDLLETLERCLPAAEEREAEKAAARSLILRYWRPGSVLTPARAEALGLGAAVVEAAAERSHPSPVADVPPGAIRIGRRPYQAVHAARQLAARYVPFLARSERSIRVAVCVSGQLRGYRAALATWRRTLLAHVAHDIFVHTWKRIGRAGAQPFRSVLPFEGEAFCAAWRQHGTLVGYEAMQARYPTLFAAIEVGSEVTETNLRETYGARAVVVEDETAPRFVGFSNQDKMHYKIYSAHRLAAESGVHYDLFLRIRPDYALRFRGFSWGDIAATCRARPIIWTDLPFGVHYGNPMIGDQIALGTPAAIGGYAAAWERYLPLARLGLAAAPVCFEGHVSLAQTTWLNRLDARRLPIKSLGLLDAERLSAPAILETLLRDADGRHDAVDQALLEAIGRDLG